MSSGRVRERRDEQGHAHGVGIEVVEIGAELVDEVAEASDECATPFAIAALRPEFVLVISGITIAFWAVPGVNAATSTIYHERVPASMHGRVFALRSSIGQALRPLGAALAGVTIARVATPSITAGGSLHGTLGRIIGTGPERAPAVVLLACAVVLAALAAWTRQSCLRSWLILVSQSVIEHSLWAKSWAPSCGRMARTSLPRCFTPRR